MNVTCIYFITAAYHHHHHHRTTWLVWCKHTALQEHVIKSVWCVLSLSV